MRAFMRYAVCPSCGRVHHFCLPPVDPVAQRYGYECPDTGQPAVLIPWGPWEVCDGRLGGAVMLRAVHNDWVSARYSCPVPGLDA